ncbi:hypothetical protein CI109_101856 [Kwoniella shandongensis]|uniref:Uncharacterized protein n=1 Tax=Kwoniella shandongensis TaxID=1734106 RepID=A0A5M6BRR6_9TREE|nr:uncharacterized protein CI109_007036 [Kwoniella shandongensis]KAA5524650.1 hypothetical protein CI109_007036 [Kwoniella shandongensis]
MVSLETAGTRTTVSTGIPTDKGPSHTGTSPAGAATTTSGYVYSYATSKIVRTAVAAGVIVLALTALVLFFKISSWIRTTQRLRRQRLLTLSLQSEQHANAYEIAAWSDEPNTAPVRDVPQKEKKSRKERREEMRALKRGGANAWAVQEWEGVAS